MDIRIAGVRSPAGIDCNQYEVRVRDPSPTKRAKDGSRLTCMRAGDWMGSGPRPL